MELIVCISHSQDVDGLGSAALIKIVKKNAKIILADYGNYLDEISALDKIDELILCDLGFNSRMEKNLLKEFTRINKFGKISYIDHHPLSDEVKQKLTDIGVNVIHSTEVCTSMLAFQYYMKKLPRKAGLIAAYGAVTDYLDNDVVSRKLIDGFDRQFVLFESTLLSHAISESRGKYVVLDNIVDGLSNLKFPHEIEGLNNLANDQVDKLGLLITTLNKIGTKRKYFAYGEADGISAGNLANLLMGEFNTPVALAYKTKKVEGVYDISIRGSDIHTNLDLGQIVGQLATKLGGFGGGHPKASGARIPMNKFDEFLNLLDEHISGQLI